jgi:hypothetical protein
MTQEAQVANVANTLISLTAQLSAIQTQITAANAAWTNLSAATKLNNFPTAALTTTGGLGTPDGSPVVTNPINTGVAPGTLLSRAVSADDLAGILGFLNGIGAGIGGSAVSANGAAVQLVAKCL